MKNPSMKKIDPNRCNQKLVEHSQKKLDNNWVEMAKKKWKKDKVLNKDLLEGIDTTYLNREYDYIRIIAGRLPHEIPECWRVQCILEGYDELLEQEKNKKQQIKDVVEKKKTKFEFRRKTK